MIILNIFFSPINTNYIFLIGKHTNKERRKNMFFKWMKFGAIFLVVFLIPLMKPQALSTVHTQEELKQALSDTSVSTITLGNDIETTEKINIMRPVTIDGNHHTLRYVGTFGSSGSKDNTVWGGIYLLQVYKTEATIKNIRLTGGNAGLLVNGSKVTLVGTIDVSGNGFGGIELAQGSGVNAVSHLVLDDSAKIVNTTETSDKPTLWVPKDSDPAVIEQDGLTQTVNPEQELTLTEINSLFEVIVNPSTNDSIYLYVICLILGSFGLLFTFRKKTI